LEIHRVLEIVILEVDIMYATTTSSWTTGIIQPCAAGRVLQVNFNTSSIPFDLLHPVNDFRFYIGKPAFDFCTIQAGNIYTAGFVELPTHYVTLYARNIDECRDIVSSQCCPLNAAKTVLYPIPRKWEVAALKVGDRNATWWGTMFTILDHGVFQQFVEEPYRYRSIGQPKTILGQNSQRIPFTPSWVLNGLLP
jgi:hypothetical protein